MPTEISPWIQRLSAHRFAVAAGGLLLALAIALAWVAWRWGVAEDRMELLQKQAEAGFLQAPSTTRAVRVDLRVNARTDRYARFRVSLLRDDGTLLVHADQVVRDSNMDLRLSFNTSLLPAGSYVLRVEGYSRGGRLEHLGEARVVAG